MAGDIQHFGDLYDRCAETLIRWSESAVLAPEYLHLHEQDIGYVSGYQLWHYPRVFVESLGDLRQHLDEVVFCYSIENVRSPSRPVHECLRDEFFWYRLDKPSEDPLTESSFTHAQGANIRTRMPKPASVTGGLREQLRECSWIQAYMLRHVDGTVEADTRLLPYSDDLIADLAANHKKDGSYQFSIYGYKFKPEYQLGEGQKAFLKVSFLTHIWTWNHDLRTIHRIRHLFSEELKKGQNRWDEVQGDVNRVFEQLSRLRLGTSQLIPLSEKYWKPGEYNLFNKPHDIADWAPELFGPFVTKVYERREALELIEFIRLCGWTSTRTLNTSKTKEIDSARGTWLSVKLLTREALPNRRTSFDQLVLSILFAANRFGLNSPIAIRRVLQHPKLASLSEEKRLMHLLLSVPELPALNWKDKSWTEESSEMQGEAYAVGTTYSSDQARAVLAEYVSSGMLAIPAGNKYKTLVLDIPSLPPETFGSEFLRSLADLVESLANQQSRSYEDWAKLEKITATEIVRANGNDDTLAAAITARLSFAFDRQLPLAKLDEHGELNPRLKVLGSYLGQPHVWEFDAEPSNCRLFAVMRDGKTEIVLRLEGDR